MEQYKEEQYQKDQRFVENVESRVSTKWEVPAYYVGMIACLAAHVLYLFLFANNGIRVMAILNIFSVAFYLLMIALIRKVRDRVNLVYASVIEIIIHATVATHCVGWKPDFGMFLLMIIPLAFLIPNKNTRIPFLIMFISLAIYGAQRYIYSGPEDTLYNIEQDKIATVLYFINFIIGVFVLIYVTIIYSILNQYTNSKLRVQAERLRLLASVDPLTKLNNRRSMNEILKQNSTDSLESGVSYVIGIGDIDNFKSVNDTYGHDFGDVVLSETAETISKNLPEKCSVARWGGEEFLFVIPASTLKEGFGIANQLVQAVREHTFRFEDKELHVTMTFGVCEGGPGSDVDKVISCADRRLYKGKNNGKNHAECTD